MKPSERWHTTWRSLDVASPPNLLAEIALSFQEAACDPKHADNEGRSAQWKSLTLAGLSLERAGWTEPLILVTRHPSAPETPYQELLLDVDVGSWEQQRHDSENTNSRFVSNIRGSPRLPIVMCAER